MSRPIAMHVMTRSHAGQGGKSNGESDRWENLRTARRAIVQAKLSKANAIPCACKLQGSSQASRKLAAQGWRCTPATTPKITLAVSATWKAVKRAGDPATRANTSQHSASHKACPATKPAAWLRTDQTKKAVATSDVTSAPAANAAKRSRVD